MASGMAVSVLGTGSQRMVWEPLGSLSPFWVCELTRFFIILRHCLPFPLNLLPVYRTVFQRLHDMYHSKLNAEAYRGNHLSFIKSDVKESCKK